MITISRNKEEKQIDRMIDEGLGGGEINSSYDKDKLNSPISDKKNQKAPEMVEGMKDAKKLGKEMEHMKTNKQVKDTNETPDPIQHD